MPMPGKMGGFGYDDAQVIRTLPVIHGAFVTTIGTVPSMTVAVPPMPTPRVAEGCSGKGRLVPKA